MRFRFGKIPVVIGFMLTVLLVLAACDGLPGRGGGEEATDFEIVAYNVDAVLDTEETTFNHIVETTDRLIVLNFWAADCPPCRAEMPMFQQVQDDLEADVLFLGIDVGVFVGLGTHNGGRLLLSDLEIDYPAGYAADADPVRDYEIRSMPTTLFISEDGRVEERIDGQMSEGMLREVLDDLL